MKFKMIHENYNVSDLDRSIKFYIVAQIHNNKIIGSLSSHLVQIKGLVVKFNRSVQV